MKFIHINHNLCAGTEMLSLTVYELIAIQILLGSVPQFGRWVELGGRVWYPVKLLHISYNLFAGIDMLSLSVYEPIAIQILLGGDRPPIWPRGGVRGSGVVPRETPPYLLQFVCWNRNVIPHRLRVNHNTNFAWGDRPPNLGEGVELGGRVWHRVKAHHNGHNLSI